MALAAKNIPVVANVPNGGVALIAASSNTVTLGSNTNGATAYTAGTAGGRVMSLTAVTDDTVTVNVFVWILRGATVIPIALVNVPLSSGNTNAARFNVDFLDGVNIVGLPLDNTGKRYIPLLAGDVLRVGALANLTAAKTCWVHASGSDYQA
ncbi:MAG TPA: hypothetical protein PKU82_03245 [Bacteroidia bacterium]|nr:hypothetical protein [Bacteroidia bacterium]HOZ90669.1 hypothetical protein [Bacteroidia bacterium]HRB52115.1 hypothetical protein [Bacteroidia bacterium]